MKSLKRAMALAVLSVALPATVAAAQKAPDVPAATPDPGKFFLFHASAGASADQVRADLLFCIGQARPILSMRDRYPSGGGLLGGLINGRMADIDRFRMRNAAMRKCMGMFGYDRYLVPEDQWKAIVKKGDIVLGDNQKVDPEVVESMVAFATGPVPAGEKLPK